MNILEKIENVLRETVELNVSTLKTDKIFPFLNNVKEYLKQKDPNFSGKMSSVGQSLRMWTRGDGSKYRDPARVEFRNKDLQKQAWTILSELEGIKTTSIKGEFGSDSFRPAIFWKDKLFILNPENSIAITTKSALRNIPVWTRKD